MNLHVLDVVCLLLSLYFVFSIKSPYKWPTFTHPLVSFWLVAAFSWIIAATNYNLTESLTAFLYLARFIVYSSLYFVIDWLLKKEKDLKEKIVSGLLIVGASISIFGLLQYLLYPDIRALKEFGWDPHLYRLFGSFLDPAFTGILIVFYLLLLLSLALNHGFKKIYIPQLLVGLGALYLTYSRASYLAFLAGLAAILIVKGKKKILGVCIGVFLFSLLLLPRTEGIGTRLERVSTIVARGQNYKETLDIISKNPLFGVGFNFYRYAAGKNLDTHSGAGADSSLLFVFATTGIVGLLVYLAMWSKILYQAWPGRVEQRVVLFSSTIALLVHSNFSNTLFYPWVLVWMGILMALQTKERS
ncbi:MAG: O-antigen ligase family protein [bacterium]|nr:O-antigen ligase family protein [bacterium]